MSDSGMAYVIERLFDMNAKTALNNIRAAARASGRTAAATAADMLRCALKYEAGPSDYYQCEFYRLSDAQRSSYVTRGVNNKLVRKLNDKRYIHIFENKTDFCRCFSRYIRRRWLDMSTASLSELSDLCGSSTVLFAKPLEGCCGRGITRLEPAQFESVEKLYEYLKTSGFGIVESAAPQHPEVNRLYPDSVNTVRMVTIVSGGKSELIFAAMRIGNGGYIDNINSGGMAAKADVDSGILIKPAADKQYHLYSVHPKTGSKIVGFHIPFWNEAKQMVLEAAKVVEQVGYVGWDVCIGPDGPELIEGNSFPGHDIYQMPNTMAPDYVGLMPRVACYL